MRRADERRSASTTMRSSIRCVLAGWQIDWITKQSMPRTFSRISTFTSPSLNVLTSALPSSRPRVLATALASGGLEFPQKSFTWFMHCLGRWLGPTVAGAAGLEPAIGGSKGRCLTSLATPQQVFARAERSFPSDGRGPRARAPQPHRRRGAERALRPLRLRLAAEDAEDRGPAAGHPDRRRSERVHALPQPRDLRGQSNGGRLEVVAHRAQDREEVAQRNGLSVLPKP